MKIEIDYELEQEVFFMNQNRVEKRYVIGFGVLTGNKAIISNSKKVTKDNFPINVTLFLSNDKDLNTSSYASVNSKKVFATKEELIKSL